MAVEDKSTESSGEMYTEKEVLLIVREALGDVNRYYCSQKLNREPTVLELVEHYLKYCPPIIHVVEFTVEDDQFPLFI